MPGKKWIKSPLKKYWNGKRGEKTTKATHLKISRFEGKRVRVAGFSNLVVFSVSLFSEESGVFELVFEGFHPLFIWQAPVLQHLAHTACLSKDLCYQEQIFRFWSWWLFCPLRHWLLSCRTLRQIHSFIPNLDDIFCYCCIWSSGVTNWGASLNFSHPSFFLTLQDL